MQLNKMVWRGGEGGGRGHKKIFAGGVFDV